jgi:bacterioferritin
MVQEPGVVLSQQLSRLRKSPARQNGIDRDLSAEGDPEPLLANELTAISQYVVHSEMCENWGYYKLHDAIQKQAREEMHHAEWLIRRILFLDGVPVVSKLNPMKIGKCIEMVGNDQEAEVAAARL